MNNRFSSMIDEWAQEFSLRRFELEITKIQDLRELQEISIKLFAQTLSQRKVYEAMLRDVYPKTEPRLPRIPPR